MNYKHSLNSLIHDYWCVLCKYHIYNRLSNLWDTYHDIWIVYIQYISCSHTSGHNVVPVTIVLEYVDLAGLIGSCAHQVFAKLGFFWDCFIITSIIFSTIELYLIKLKPNRSYKFWLLLLLLLLLLFKIMCRHPNL